MTSCTTCVQDDGGTWSAEHCAVSAEWMANDDGTRQIVMLRHPSYPFIGSVPDQGGSVELQAELRSLALKYLKRVSLRVGIEPTVQALTQASEKFNWLDLSWGAGAHAAPRDPRHSFWVTRTGGGTVADRTVVLLAGQRDKNGRGLGGEIGLRVVMHVPAVPAQGRWEVRITGVSMSNLPTAQDIERIGVLISRDINSYLTLLQSLFRFAQPPAIQGVALLTNGTDRRIRIFGAGGQQDDNEFARTYSFISELDIDATDGSSARTIARLERLSHANVFLRDPSSSNTKKPVPLTKRRPTRPAAFLDQFRQSTNRLPEEEIDYSGNSTGRISLKDSCVEVRQTRIGNDHGDPSQVQEVAAGGLALRSDELAAVHAYVRGQELFARLKAYGFVADDYFKLAKLPLLLRHRAPMRGAGDGKTVNAQVRPSGDGLSLLAEWAGPGGKDQRAVLEVGFAAGNLAHRMLLPNDGMRLRAQPLGLAADPRWAWHEFGHVLSFASTGALEFRFAHSAGDALAAIVSDPDSVLARTERGVGGNATFPWVPISRHHNRDVGAGWCWCGRRNVARQAGATDVDTRRLGYFQEQLMSSSLFRAYCTIGGDTFADLATRRSASDYMVYLIMRAIALLGPEVVVPARTADHFVSALIDADVGTGVWDITADWPEGATRGVLRMGGCVHKVLRWAFEMQGMYATEDPFEVKEGAGRPPCVDIYIEDQRGGEAGGYRPVALVRNDGGVPLWHASAQAISVSQGSVNITVGNRGQLDARGVTVTVRVSPAQGSPAWTTLTPNPSAPQDVPVWGSVVFAFAAVDPATGAALQAPYRVWASATCAADRSNDDPNAKLPCSALPTPLIDLVANDNNQAYCVIQAK
jgi:hypothetical protein